MAIEQEHPNATDYINALKTACKYIEKDAENIVGTLDDVVSLNVLISLEYGAIARIETRREQYVKPYMTV